MQVPFQSLCELLEKVETTKKRLSIIDQTANYLKTLSSEEIGPAVNMMVGRAFPKYTKKTLDISWSTLIHVMKCIGGTNWVSFFNDAMKKTADIGSAAKLSLEQTKAKRQTQLTQETLTILEVQRTFEAIAHTEGAGTRRKKERLLITLFGQAKPLEVKYLVKIFTAEMRTGLHEGLMEQAVALAFDVYLQKVQNATMVLGDIGGVATTLKIKGVGSLDLVAFCVFRPVKLMLAQPAETISQALMEHGKTAFEYKYDGARVQIHLKDRKVKIFSRRLSDVTKSLPDIVEVVQQNIKAQSIIVEGEVMALDSSGCPLAFQHLMRRFRRIREVGDMQQKIPLTLYLFDILYLNGDSLIAKPYIERRQILAENICQINLSHQIVTEKAEEADTLLKQALAAGHEGLMAKKPDSSYTPGRRGKRWLKIKNTLEPLDLVITAAEYGYGRRKGWLSDYYLAARDPISGEFLDIGKTFKGLTDVELIDLTRQLKEIAVTQQGHKVVVIPKIVVEIAYNEIQQSPRYKNQMALRFARITRIRDDKTPEEASTISEVREIYERQFQSKSKYNAQ